MSNKKIIPKLNVDDIHRDLKHHFVGFRYLVLTENKVDDELYVMTTFQKEEAIKLLKDLIVQLEKKNVIETNIDSEDLTKLN